MEPAVGTDRPPEVRARARRIRRREVFSSAGFRSAVRLGLIAVYSIVFMWGGFFDWAGWTETILWSAGALLWIVLAVILGREIAAATGRWHYVRTHSSLPLLLIAPAFLWLVWMPVVAFLLVVVAYVMELRHHSAGDGFLFSFGLVLFVGVFAGLSMVEVENENADSSLRSPSDAIFWAFASLLRINYGKSMTPETEDGRILATVVGICAILGASLFTAQVVSWVVGSKHEQKEKQEAARAAADEQDRLGAQDDVLAELVAIRSELAALRAQVEAGSAGATDREGRVRP